MKANIHQSLFDFMCAYKDKKDAPALARGGAHMSYPKLLKEIDRVAAGLYKAGVRKGDVVMLALPNIFQGVVALYAVSRIGAVAGMIHPLLSGAEFKAAVEKQKPKAVFLSDINAKEFSKHCGGAKKIFCPFLSYGFVGLPKGKGFEEFHDDGESTALLMQSGGTAGHPKTIELSSRAVNAMTGNLLEFVGKDYEDAIKHMIVVLPMFHGFGLCIGVHTTLCMSSTAVLLARFKVEKVVDALKKHPSSVLLAVPRMVIKLLACEKFAGDAAKNLLDVFVGGDNVDDDLAGSFEKHMQKEGGTARLLPGYGLTETVTVCTLTWGKPEPTLVGVPIGDVGVKIVDEDLMEVPPMQAGELLLSGNQLMTGYLHDEQATKNVFAYLDGEKFVRTGDMFKRDESGRLFFLGRKKRLIKISGMNVFPSEIERVAQELPFVGACAAVQYRESGKPFIRLLLEGEFSSEQKAEILEHIKKNLSHWNVPSDIVCVSEFPRTNVGKTDIARLEREYGEK